MSITRGEASEGRLDPGYSRVLSGRGQAGSKKVLIKREKGEEGESLGEKKKR